METEKIKSIKYKGHSIDIYQDENYQSPDDWGDEEVFLVHYHKDFEVRRDDIVSKDEMIKWYNGEKIELTKQYHIFLVKAYIHSGVVLALEKSGRIFPDEQWDVSRCGCVLVSKKTAKIKAKAYKLAEGLIETWNDNLSGNVFGYMVDDKDGCWGFYGDYDENGLIEEAKGEIDGMIAENIKKNNKRIKAYIKNSVDIAKRQPAII